MESSSLDLTLPLQTRDGRPVRILCTDKKGRTPLVGLIDNGTDESVFCWWPDGSLVRRGDHTKTPADLVNVPMEA